jgi:hypothetical protein
MCDGRFEIGKFFAAGGTQSLEQHGVLARLVDLAGLDVKLAQIFERALVLRIEVERLAVERVGLLPVTVLRRLNPIRL